jgi:hypothetical protein
VDERQNALAPGLASAIQQERTLSPGPAPVCRAGLAATAPVTSPVWTWASANLASSRSHDGTSRSVRAVGETHHRLSCRRFPTHSQRLANAQRPEPCALSIVHSRSGSQPATQGVSYAQVRPSARTAHRATNATRSCSEGLRSRRQRWSVLEIPSSPQTDSAAHLRRRYGDFTTAAPPTEAWADAGDTHHSPLYGDRNYAICTVCPANARLHCRSNFPNVRELAIGRGRRRHRATLRIG